jgi:hypothetical protein
VSRTSLVITVALACFSLSAFAENATATQRMTETTAKADKLFGRHYTAALGKPLRLYYKQTETVPPSEIIYSHGAGYVIELIFAADGTIAALLLHPETLLYSDDWNDVPPMVVLSDTEMRSFANSANALQSLGRVREITKVPQGCFQSGPNLYCTDSYDLASVSHDHVERGNAKHATGLVLRGVAVIYTHPVIGVVEDAKREGSQRLIKVGGQWYHGEKPGVEIFEKAQVGSRVRLITYGCAANAETCVANPEQPPSPQMSH